MTEFTVKFRSTFIICLFGSIMFFVFFILSTIAFIIEMNNISYLYILPPIVFIFFTALCSFGFLYSREAFFGEEAITAKTYFGVYSIKLSEIKYIEIGNGNLIIGNDTKRISMPSHEYWDKNLQKIFLESCLPYLYKYEIKYGLSLRAFLPIFRNSKI